MRSFRIAALIAVTMSLLPEAVASPSRALTFQQYCERLSTLPPAQRVVAQMMVDRVRTEAQAGGAADVSCTGLATAAATLFKAGEMIGLDISIGTAPTSFDLTPLASLESLEDLVLVVGGVSADNAAVLSGLVGLKQLHVVCASAEQEPCPWERPELLGNLTGLEMLLVTGMRLETSKPLASLQRLQMLRLERTTLRDLSGIGLLVGLRDLSISSNTLVDLTDLMALINLRTLTLTGNPQLQDIMAVQYMSNLEQLYLGDCGVHDLAALHGLSWLHTLDVNATANDGTPRVKTLAPLKDLLHLHSLKMANHQLDDAGFAAMGPQPVLKELDLSGNAVTQLDGVAAMKELRILTLARLPHVQSYAPLAGLERLGHLNLSASGLTAVPESLAGAKSLRGLDLSQNRLDAASVGTLATVAQLRELFLIDAGLTDLALVPKLPRLSLLDVSGNAIASLAPLADWPALKNVIARDVPAAARVCPPSLSCTF